MRLNPFKPIYAECNEGNSRQKIDNLPIFPRCLDIELTNLCNFKCLMCPTGTGAHQRKKGLMSDAVFDKIIDEIKKYKTPLRFIRWGEPTLHPIYHELHRGKSYECSRRGVNSACRRVEYRHA